MEFGMTIKQARTEKGLSVNELAEAIGVKSPGYISRIEGRGEIPGPDMIIQLVNVLGIDTKKLFQLAGKEKGDMAKNAAKDKYKRAFAFYRKSKKKE